MVAPRKFPEEKLLVPDLTTQAYAGDDAVTVHVDDVFHLVVDGRMREIGAGGYTLSPTDAWAWVRAGRGRVRVVGGGA